MKYSFIIPIYNGEKYIDRCIPSILNQAYENLELIVINDGSTDKSLNKLKKYVMKDNRIKIFSISKNSGVSNARNYGLEKVTGDYVIFVDIDDLIDVNMLVCIESSLAGNMGVDIVKYDYLSITDTNNIENNHSIKINNNILNGTQVFTDLVEKKIPFDMNCIYAFNTSYIKTNNFKFEVGKYHEDFGLIPYILIKANRVMLIDKVLYYYVQSQNSITRNVDNNQKLKRFKDILYHFDNLFQKIKKESSIAIKVKKIFMSYIANAVIFNYLGLRKQDRITMKIELRNRKIVDLLLGDTMFRRIKKLIYKIML